MKLLFMALGSRGDVEPFLAQAALFDDSYEIMCIFPEQFREEVEGLGYAFEGFPAEFLELLSSQTGKQVMGGQGGFIEKAKGYIKLMRSSMKLQRTIVEIQKNTIDSFQPDRVMYHAKCLYGMFGGLVKPEKYIAVHAMPCLTHPSSKYPHIGFGKWNLTSSFWIKASYSFVNGVRRRMIKRFLGQYYSDYPEVDFSPSNFKRLEEQVQTTIYAISPSLFPKPEEWPDTAKIPGYLHRDQTTEYTPMEGLETWLEKNPKAILLTFGSMNNTRPKEISEIFVRLLSELKIPAIINTSWGGLEEVENAPDSIFFVNHIPYDYLMPKLYGVIHHGGSGTTHLTSYYSCVQLIIPHIIDQYFWNRLVSDRALGPKGISVHHLNEKKLKPLLIDFWNNETYAANASDLASKMQNESSPDEVKEIILNPKL